MAEKEKKPRKIYDGSVPCPHCSKSVKVKIEREIIEPSVPAQTELKIYAEKNDQTSLIQEVEELIK